MASLVPLPAINVPSGQIEEQPLRTQEPQGATRSHFNLEDVSDTYYVS
jgi:hypothetical protein